MRSGTGGLISHRRFERVRDSLLDMKTASVVLLFGLLGCFAGCGSDEEESPAKSGDGDGDSVASTFEVEEIVFDLGGERSLTTLTDQEIRGACETMADVFDSADAGVACQIVAAAEADEDACEAKLQDCLQDPEDALEQTSVRSAPAPVDCSVFNVELTEECDHPVSLLEDCVNALAQSVVPAAEAVDCGNAAGFEDIDAAHAEAAMNKSPDFVSICIDLLECEALVGALLSDESGAGGAPN